MVGNRDILRHLFHRKIAIKPENIRRIRTSLILSFCLLVLFGAYGAGCLDSNRMRVNKWLTFHHLAPLPDSVTNIMYYQWNGLFTGETYIKVQLSRNELADFIANSPGLAEGKMDAFSSEHQYLPYRNENDRVNDSHRHNYFEIHPKFPNWFDPTITNSGELYILWRGPNSQVLINRDTLTVLLRGIKG